MEPVVTSFIPLSRSAYPLVETERESHLCGYGARGAQGI